MGNRMIKIFNHPKEARERGNKRNISEVEQIENTK